MSTYPSIMIRTETEARRVMAVFCKAKRMSQIRTTIMTNQLLESMKRGSDAATDVYLSSSFPDTSIAWMTRDPKRPIHPALYPVNSIEQALGRVRKPSR